MRQRVLAYVTRERDGVKELLVFDHRDHPERGDAGSRRPHRSRRDARGVPAPRARRGGRASGTAIVRELGRPAGRRSTRIARSRFARDGNPPDAWEHEVHGTADDAGLVFRYRWEPCDARPELFNRATRMLESCEGTRDRRARRRSRARRRRRTLPAAGRLLDVPGRQPVEHNASTRSRSPRTPRDHRDDRRRHRPPPRLRLGQVGRRPDRDPVRRRSRDPNRKSALELPLRRRE